MKIFFYNRRNDLLVIPTRNYINYGNDGLFTNDAEVIKQELKQKNSL
jgi:hypothetical protein